MHDDLTMVKKQKLRWYGHISISSNSAGDSQGNKKETKIEEEMGRQHQNTDMIGV